MRIIIIFYFTAIPAITIHRYKGTRSCAAQLCHSHETNRLLCEERETSSIESVMHQLSNVEVIIVRICQQYRREPDLEGAVMSKVNQTKKEKETGNVMKAEERTSVVTVLALKDKEALERETGRSK
jgi:hypothetical protein